MRALVTGATGLVGSHIVRALLEQGEVARALVRPSSDRSAIADLPIEIGIGDVLDRETLVSAMAGCDAVFHAAAHFAYWGKTADELAETAIRGTENVLEAAAAAGISRVVVTSSSVVLGYGDSPSVRDEHSIVQDDTQVPYVTAKIKQDQLALQTAARLNVDVVLACPTLVVGPFAPSLGPSNAVLTAYLEDPFRFTYPGGCNVVAAADVGRGHALLAGAGSPGERYILGAENLEWSALHSLISELCGTFGPSLAASHSACYLAAAAEEVRAEVLGRAPLTTRLQATMVGRYYWYSHAKAAALGFSPAAANDAVATALSWLVASAHLSREARTRLQLSGAVWTARRQLRDSERRLRRAA